MFTYQFVRIDVVSGFASMKPAEDYRAVIALHAREGWRFIQAFAPSLDLRHQPSYIELIFEKSATEPLTS